MPGGRVVTYDRVFLPSHEAAYRDESVDVKSVTTTAGYAQLMESLTNYAFEKSSRVSAAMEGTDPISSSMCVDDRGVFSVNTKHDGRLFIPTEKKLAREISHYMKNL